MTDRASSVGRGREFAVALLASLAASAVLHWPVVLGLTSRLPKDLIDSALKAWEVALYGELLGTGSFDLLDANMLWPLDDPLAFTDASPGLAPAGVLATSLGGAVAVYNVLYLLAFALPFAGTFLLAREFGSSRGAAAVGGAIFAFAPWRIAHDSHIQVLMSAGIPLSIFLLLRGIRRPSAMLVLAGCLVAAWQVLVGLGLGLQLAYLLLVLLVGVALGWWRGALPRPPRRVLLAVAAGAAIFAAIFALRAWPYLDVADRYPGATRSKFEVASLSPYPHSYLVAPADSAVWGALTSPLRDRLRTEEQALFLGLTATLLALAGWRWAPFPARLRHGLAAGTAFAALLSLGLHVSLGRLGYVLPYSWLYELAPGWEGVRTPGRLVTLTTLGVALLAAGGADGLRARMPRRAALVAPILVALVVLEGVDRVPYPSVPPVPKGQLAVPSPQLHLPILANDSLYLLWSVEEFPVLVNGVASFTLPEQERLRVVAERFPTQTSVESLELLGVRAVVLHLDLAPGTAWAETRARQANVPRDERGSVLVYRLRGAP